MKLIGRILIILGVTWLIVMGLNWLRMQNMLPINPDTARSERFVDGEHREGFMRPGRGFGEFRERGERHFEKPSLDGVGDVLGTLTRNRRGYRPYPALYEPACASVRIAGES
jgi:hypothetical protein